MSWYAMQSALYLKSAMMFIYAMWYFFFLWELQRELEKLAGINELYEFMKEIKNFTKHQEDFKH